MDITRAYGIPNDEHLIAELGIGEQGLRKRVLRLPTTNDDAVDPITTSDSPLRLDFNPAFASGLNCRLKAHLYSRRSVDESLNLLTAPARVVEGQRFIGLDEHDMPPGSSQVDGKDATRRIPTCEDEGPNIRK